MLKKFEEDQIAGDVAELVPGLLRTLEALAYAGRHLHPPKLPELIPLVKNPYSELVDGRTRFAKKTWPGGLAFYQQRLMASADYAIAAVDSMEKAVLDTNPVMRAFQALRKTTRAVEALYPLAEMLPPVSKFFNISSSACTLSSVMPVVLAAAQTSPQLKKYSS